MPLRLEEIETEALRLDENSRAELANRLLRSLDGPEERDVERAWIEEALRRQEDLEQGRVSPIPADEVFSKLLAKAPESAPVLEGSIRRKVGVAGANSF